MRGITFGGYHSFDSFGLLLRTKEIGTPVPKIDKIEVKGADGALDLTEFFGDVKYNDVVHKFVFTVCGTQAEMLAQFANVKNALHGKKLRIILDDDPSYYYWGRCNVLPFTNDKNIGTISIDCECDPYRYKLTQTVATRAVNGTDNIVLTNGRKRAVPSITTNAAMTIAFGGGTWTRSAGTFAIPELELVQGNNTVTVTGTGTITFRWHEGDL